MSLKTTYLTTVIYFTSCTSFADGLVITYYDEVNVIGKHTNEVKVASGYIPYNPSGNETLIEIKGNTYVLKNRVGQCNYIGKFVSNSKDQSYTFSITTKMPNGCTQKGVVKEYTPTIWKGHIKTAADGCKFPIELRGSSRMNGNQTAWMIVGSTNSASKACQEISIPHYLFQVTRQGKVMTLHDDSPPKSDIQGFIDTLPGFTTFSFEGQSISGYIGGSTGAHLFTISGILQTLDE